jgi:hypothetical protein
MQIAFQAFFDTGISWSPTPAALHRIDYVQLAVDPRPEHICDADQPRARSLDPTPALGEPPDRLDIGFAGDAEEVRR